MQRATNPDRSPSAHHVHVLVVDDYGLLRQELRSLLSAYDEFEVVGEAENGVQACELAQQLQPNVIIMDVHMPTMNGLEATRHIKARLPHIIIIGLSINTSSPVADEMKAAGASAYLSKDTDPQDLYQAIQSALVK